MFTLITVTQTIADGQVYSEPFFPKSFFLPVLALYHNSITDTQILSSPGIMIILYKFFSQDHSVCCNSVLGIRSICMSLQ